MTKNDKEQLQLGKIADSIGGEVWHSGGGIFGVRVWRSDSNVEFFFGFADGVLGWDIADDNGDLLEIDIPNPGNLTIDQTDAVVATCLSVMKQAIETLCNEEIEQLITNADLGGEWEKQARRLIYKYMSGYGFNDYDCDSEKWTNALLDTKLDDSDGMTIRDYYEYMKDQAESDRECGFNATFAMDFVRAIASGLQDD